MLALTSSHKEYTVSRNNAISFDHGILREVEMLKYRVLLLQTQQLRDLS